MSSSGGWVALCDEPSQPNGSAEHMSLVISGISSGTVSLPPSHVDVNRYVADLVRREIRLGLLPPARRCRQNVILPRCSA